MFEVVYTMGGTFEYKMNYYFVLFNMTYTVTALNHQMYVYIMFSSKLRGLLIVYL